MDYRDLPKPKRTVAGPNQTPAAADDKTVMNGHTTALDRNDNGRYDKITCLEMAEHVGVKNFQAFLRQVYDLLEDDGIFFLQIAGLRRAWQYEDLLWGLFMGKYVFPGADASCPLGWVIDQVEAAGFEVHSSETIGIHYSATIQHWYNNWNKPEHKAHIVQTYGEKWWRKWAWFLGWSVISPEHGCATCYQIVLHKNTQAFDRKRHFITERASYKI
jgi:cyclopropane fatty-acyl-phospholipid synthase-like methyltransferase